MQLYFWKVSCLDVDIKESAALNKAANSGGCHRMKFCADLTQSLSLEWYMLSLHLCLFTGWCSFKNTSEWIPRKIPRSGGAFQEAMFSDHSRTGEHANSQRL